MKLLIEMFLIFVFITGVPISLAIFASTNCNFEMTKESVTLQILGDHWSGSGFILENGIVITAAHVLYGIEDGRVIFADGDEIILDPNTYMIDEVWDVAIAKISGYDGPCASLGDSDSIVIGASVELVGYPFGEKLWHSFGEIARLEHAGTIDIDCDANPGNSGGPIFIGDTIVGVLTCGYNNSDVNSGIAVNVIRTVIDRYEILKD